MFEKTQAQIRKNITRDIEFLERDRKVVEQEIVDVYRTVKDFGSADYTKTDLAISAINAKKLKIKHIDKQLRKLRKKYDRNQD